eukprot:2793445-Prymnesium_polylepis.1
MAGPWRGVRPSAAAECTPRRPRPRGRRRVTSTSATGWRPRSRGRASSTMRTATCSAESGCRIAHAATVC